MEKEKKITKQPAKKVTKTTEVKTVKVAPKTVKPAKESVKPESVVETTVKEPANDVKKAKMTLNQELNLLVGLFSLLTIVSFCFAFQGGTAELSGWEILLKSGDYSGVFQALMIAYVVTIFIDCVLAIRIDTDNFKFDIVEKALYMITLIMNFIIIAVLLNLISKVGVGFIIFFIISIVSAIVKFARIYTQK